MRRIALAAVIVAACTRAPGSPTPTRAIVDELTPTCPGSRTGEVCDVHLQPRCAADEHVRVIDCKPTCVANALCQAP